MNAWNIPLIDGRCHPDTARISEQYQRSGGRRQIAGLDIALDNNTVNACANHILIEACPSGALDGARRPRGSNGLVTGGARYPAVAKKCERAPLGQRRALALRDRLFQKPTLIGVVESEESLPFAHRGVFIDKYIHDRRRDARRDRDRPFGLHEARCIDKLDSWADACMHDPHLARLRPPQQISAGDACDDEQHRKPGTCSFHRGSAIMSAACHHLGKLRSDACRCKVDDHVMDNMHAMQCDGPGSPLRPVERPIPRPAADELLIEVLACGICRTDLHVVDGDIPACYPIIPGHEIVGRIAALGAGVAGFATGQRIGVPWLGHTCGDCIYCRTGHENLCDQPVFTGCTRDGGYASHVVADARYCFPLPDNFSDVDAAPLLCAGLIGWRALRLAGDGKAVGLYGFGAAAHIIAQILRWQQRDIFAFTRPGDAKGQAFARSLGCVWAGSSEEAPPVALDAALIFAPVGGLVPAALKAVRKGGQVVCAGIHMTDIPSFPYADLWGERVIRSVANLTREDGTSFFGTAARAGIRTVTESFPLSAANEALARLRDGQIEGAAVLVP